MNISFSIKYRADEKNSQQILQKPSILNGKAFEMCNIHSPLISPGGGKILEYDNKIESVENDGISFVLYDNVWGTNFPLWYEENERFKFEIKEQK